MEFCENCENMLYFRVDGETTLTKYCKNCNFSKSDDYNDGSVILIDNKVEDHEAFLAQFKSKYILHDPTLPRVKNIKCTNPECTAKENEVIYIKYDQKEMKYLYHCVHCRHFWI
jgi:DNA-directed RNA polymerase subunit M/transcription elongation factor TFIIS